MELPEILRIHKSKDWVVMDLRGPRRFLTSPFGNPGWIGFGHHSQCPARFSAKKR